MVKTTKLGSTLRDHAHDGRGCTCSLMQDAPELSLEPLPRPEEIGLRTARNYDMMQRVSETTSAKRAEMRRLLTVVQGRFQSGDQATPKPLPRSRIEAERSLANVINQNAAKAVFHPGKTALRQLKGLLKRLRSRSNIRKTDSI